MEVWFLKVLERFIILEGGVVSAPPFVVKVLSVETEVFEDESDDSTLKW